MVRNILITSLFLGLSLLTFAQATYGTLEGIITDKITGEGLIAASVVVLKFGTYEPIIGGSTYIDGTYSILEIPPGQYDIDITYCGYNSQTIKNILIEEGKVLRLDIALLENKEQICEVITFVNIPLIKQDKMENGRVYKKEDIEKSPLKW